MEDASCFKLSFSEDPPADQSQEEVQTESAVDESLPFVDHNTEEATEVVEDGTQTAPEQDYQQQIDQKTQPISLTENQSDDFDSKISLTESPFQSDSEIKYVYQITRHGARSPVKDFGGQGFSQPAGMLSAAGMRQRYLLGKMNRQRYVDQYKFLSQSYKKEEINIMSTDIYRTMQSAYSEIQGLYPAKSQDSKNVSLYTLQEHQIVSLLEKNPLKQKNILPFKSRNFKKVQEELLDQSAIDGFLAIPMYTKIKRVDNFCPYTKEKQSQYSKLESTYFPHQVIFDRLKTPLQKIFQFKDEVIDKAKFYDVGSFVDILVAKFFEGIVIKYDFQIDEIHDILEYQKWQLTRPMAKEQQVQKLFSSQLLSNPLKTIGSIVDKDIQGQPQPNYQKYNLFSAHDMQILNLWQFLEPINFLQDDLTGQYSEWFHCPYASHITIELHRLKNCTDDDKSGKSAKCFYMMFISNGQPLQFKDLNPYPMNQNLVQLKSPKDKDQSVLMQDARLKQGMYPYIQIKQYLDRISFDGKGYYGDNIQKQCKVSLSHLNNDLMSKSAKSTNTSIETGGKQGTNDNNSDKQMKKQLKLKKKQHKQEDKSKQRSSEEQKKHDDKKQAKKTKKIQKKQEQDKKAADAIKTKPVNISNNTQPKTSLSQSKIQKHIQKVDSLKKKKEYQTQALLSNAALDLDSVAATLEVTSEAKVLPPVETAQVETMTDMPDYQDFDKQMDVLGLDNQSVLEQMPQDEIADIIQQQQTKGVFEQTVDELTQSDEENPTFSPDNIE